MYVSKLCGEKLCVKKLCEDKLCAAGGREAGDGQGGSAQPNTRTPHNDVGKKHVSSDPNQLTFYSAMTFYLLFLAFYVSNIFKHHPLFEESIGFSSITSPCSIFVS